VLNFENTDEGSTFWLSKGMAECVVTVGGLQPTFTMSMGGVRKLVTGENTTPVWSAYAESVTHLDTSED
jgi:hypothetical protein